MIEVKNLYKNFLFILEDLKDKDYDIDDETYQKLRKREVQTSCYSNYSKKYHGHILEEEFESIYGITQYRAQSNFFLVR